MSEEYEIEGDEPQAQPPKRRRFRGLAILVALFVVGAFGGVVWYAYSEGQSSQAGAVAPILKAEEGPTKVKPDQPGGMSVPHQDKLVLNNMQQPASGQGSGQVERLLAPPETPVPRPVPPPAAATPSPPPTAPAAGGSSTATTSSAGVPTPIAPPPPAVIAVPPAAQSAPNPAPSQSATLPPPPAAPPPVTSAGTQPPASPAPPRSTAAQAIAAPPPAKQQAATTPSGSGDFRVQLGAVRSPEAANKEWDHLKRTIPELAPMQLTVVRADLGAEKGVYYRIQAGPLSSDNAKLLCDALKTRNQGCLVVKP